MNAALPEPTIFALASAPGRAGVAIIRLSGPAAGSALQQLTRQALPAPRQASLRKILRTTDGALLDRAMVLWFPAPQSFTGEDVAELHLHGGRAIISAVSAALAAIPGMRLAEPGEFTRRGFENGKFDLTGAEAIADLVHAETEAQLHQALRQMDGALAQLYEGWREHLVASLAYSEASIDFADEELPPDLLTRQSEKLQSLHTAIAAHLADNRRGERLRDGFRIAILGPPNAGKSSLLNALAQRDAAIVSATAGTTRDVVEVQLDLGGYPVILADTAGLRETTDAIESEGIRRARARAEQADLKLLVFDGAHWPALDPLTSALADAQCFLILNKADLLPKQFSAAELTKPQGVLWPISLHSGAGLDNLLRGLTEHVAAALPDRGTPVLTRLRHRTALESCLTELDCAIKGLDNHRESALIAEHIRRAAQALGRITGRVDVEDLLDIIFRDFCIGK